MFIAIDDARRLLGDPKLPTKTISAQAGYEDQHYVSKVFAREEGMTPSADRQANLLPG